MTLKKCTKCLEEKDLDQFTNELKRSDGKYPWCRSCLSFHRKARYKKIPRKVWITQKVCSKCKEWKPRESYRKYTGNNLHYRCIDCEDQEQKLTLQGLTECSSCGVAKPIEGFYKSRLSKNSKQCMQCQKSYSANPDIKLRVRDQTLKRYYGISLEDYKDLLKKQDYACPICLKPFEKDYYSYPVDHAHSGPNAGVIRAILHDLCNRFVMSRHSDPEILRRAANLIEEPLTNWFVPEEYLKSRKKKRRKRQ